MTVFLHDMQVWPSDSSGVKSKLRSFLEISHHSKTKMFRTTLRRLADAPQYTPRIRGPLTAENNPYKARKVWPPDFDNVPHKHQFRFERKYRRRLKIKTTSESWNRGVKVFTWTGVAGTHSYSFVQVQLLTVPAITVYNVLFHDWYVPPERAGERPFETVGQFQRQSCIRANINEDPGLVLWSYKHDLDIFFVWQRHALHFDAFEGLSRSTRRLGILPD